MCRLDSPDGTRAHNHRQGASWHGVPFSIQTILEWGQSNLSNISHPLHWTRLVNTTKTMGRNKVYASLPPLNWNSDASWCSLGRFAELWASLWLETWALQICDAAVSLTWQEPLGTTCKLNLWQFDLRFWQLGLWCRLPFHKCISTLWNIVNTGDTREARKINFTRIL